MKDKIFKYIYPIIFDQYFWNDLYWWCLFKGNIHDYHDIAHYYYYILDFISGNTTYILNDIIILVNIFDVIIVHCDILELFKYIHYNKQYRKLIKQYYTNITYKQLIKSYDENNYIGDNIRNHLLSVKYLE